MKRFSFSYLVLFLLPGFGTAQSVAELGSILFPDDQYLDEVFNMMRSTLDKSGAKRFYKIASEGNNRRNMPLSSVADRGLTGEYRGKELSIYTNDLAIIRKMEVEGRNLSLFGSTRQSDHLKTLQGYPDFLYEYQDGKLGGFLLPQMEMTALLKYKNGQLSKIEITRHRYSRYKSILEKQQAQRIIERVWDQHAVPIDDTRPLNLSNFPATCVRNCGENTPRWLFGRILYKGPIVNGVPDGEGKWGILDSCKALFNHSVIQSINKGRFDRGVPIGWHTIDYDSLEMEVKYDQGMITEIKGGIIALPMLGVGRVASKMVNGKLHDPAAVIYTGDDHATPMAFVQGNPQPNGPLTYYNRNGERVTTIMQPDGQLQNKIIMRSPGGGIEWTRFLDAEGQIIPNRSRLTERYWDIGQGDLYPKSIVVEGDIVADLVNEKWGGENLTITFPGTNLTIKGSFIPAFGFTISTAPDGTHTLRGSWKGKSYNQTAVYEKGRFKSGEDLYKIATNVPTKPISLNFERIQSRHPISSHEQEIELPCQEVYGIAIEQAIPEDKVCSVDIIFMDENGEEARTKKVKNVSKLSSIDFSNFLEHNKKPLKSVVVKREKCNGFLWVYFYK